MISFKSGSPLLSYFKAQSGTSGSSGGTTTGTNSTISDAATARITALSQTALQAAGAKPQAWAAGQALAKRQEALGNDFRAALTKSGVKLSGPVEFSVRSDGAVAISGNDADKAAVYKVLKADKSSPTFAARVAMQAKDALTASASIQQTAAISQAVRTAGKSGNVMAMYGSLMQQSNATPAVFTVSPTTSSLSYPGSLATKA